MVERDGFFVGWAAPPAGLRGFLLICAAGLVALFAATAYFIAATADDPGDGAFRFDWGPQSIVGRLQLRPYPVVHVIEAERFEPGHALMLAGQGKRGVQERAAGLDGQVVAVSGIVLKRGDLDMLQVDGAADALVALDGREGPPPQIEALGRWRVTGEVCDGKCYAGAMRPGDGLAHRACAGLCLIGGVPPVFVSTGPVAGAEFFLLADGNGGPVTAQILDHVATLVEVEGSVERHGSLMVFKIDPGTMRLAR